MRANIVLWWPQREPHLPALEDRIQLRNSHGELQRQSMLCCHLVGALTHGMGTSGWVCTRAGAQQTLSSVPPAHHQPQAAEENHHPSSWRCGVSHHASCRPLRTSTSLAALCWDLTIVICQQPGEEVAAMLRGTCCLVVGRSW